MKKNYCNPESHLLTFEIEGPLCASGTHEGITPLGSTNYLEDDYYENKY